MLIILYILHYPLYLLIIIIINHPILFYLIIYSIIYLSSHSIHKPSLILYLSLYYSIIPTLIDSISLIYSILNIHSNPQNILSMDLFISFSPFLSISSIFFHSQIISLTIHNYSLIILYILQISISFLISLFHIIITYNFDELLSPLIILFFI